MGTIDQLYFTSCSRDQGRGRYDGFQVKACSAGISPKIEATVKFFSERYRWPSSLNQMVRPGKVPEEDWARFPISLHLYLVPDGRLGLTRICFSPEQPPRAGNFFAHTLVFPPEVLAPLNFNPFSLARSEVFQQADDTDQILLPYLDSFPEVKPPESLPYILPQYAPYLGALVDAATNGRLRPLVVIPTSWHDAWNLAEAILLALPPRFRLQVELSIYEPDPYRILQNRKKTGNPIFIATILADEGGRLELRPEEYKSQFSLFNFPEQKFSPFTATSAYASRVEEDLKAQRPGALQSLHRYLALFGADASPERWPEAIGPFNCFQPGCRPTALELDAALQFLERESQTPQQAEAVLELIIGALGLDIAKFSLRDLQNILVLMQALLPRTNDPALTQKLAGETLTEPMRGLLAQGEAAQVMALARLLGPAGPPLLGAAVEYLLSTDWSRLCGPSRATQAALSDLHSPLVEVLERGLYALLADPSSKLRLKAVVPQVLPLADCLGCLRELWQKLRRWIFQELLDTLERAEALALVKNLESAIPSRGYPDIWLDLLRWRLRAKALEPEAQAAIFPVLVAACRGLPSTELLQVLKELQANLASNSFYSLLNLFAADLEGLRASPAWEIYQQQMSGVPEARQWQQRRILAQQGLFHLPAREFARALFPWSKDRHLPIIKVWIKQLFYDFPEIGEPLASALGKTASTGNRQDVFEIFCTILQELDAVSIDPQGNSLRGDLALGLINIVPVESLSEALARSLRGIRTEGWPPPALARLGLLREITSAKDLYYSEDLSLALLIQKMPRLEARLQSGDLTASERDQARTWIMNLSMEGRGITEVDSAVALLNLVFGSADALDRQNVLTEFLHILKKTDLVKQVMALSQFALADYDGRHGLAGPLLHYLAGSLKVETRQALHDYLANRRREPQWFKFLRSFQDPGKDPGQHPDKHHKGERWFRKILGFRTK